MKKILSLILFLTSLLNAQNLTNQEMLEFYPNKTGNSWSYFWVYYNFQQDYYEAKMDEVFIAKDTTVNNKNYKIIKYNYGGFNSEKYCERVDSITGDVLRISDFDTNEISRVDSVYAGIGDTISIRDNRHLLDCDKMVIISIRDTVINDFEITIREVVGLPMNKRLFFARNIGMLGSSQDYWIDSANVNGIIYSNISSDIADVDIDKLIVNNFILYQNYPNPFNPSTTISYSLSESGFVQLNVYDILGREVVYLVNKEQTMGNYKTTFNASNLTSGIYFYKLQTGNFIETKKLILLR